jgi:hypothetical protein
MVFIATFNDISAKLRRQFYWRRKPECPEKTTDESQVISKLYPIMLDGMHFAGEESMRIPKRPNQKEVNMIIYNNNIEEIVLAIKQIHSLVNIRHIVHLIASKFLLIDMHCSWKTYVSMPILAKKRMYKHVLQEVGAPRMKCAIFQIHSVKTWH